MHASDPGRSGRGQYFVRCDCINAHDKALHLRPAVRVGSDLEERERAFGRQIPLGDARSVLSFNRREVFVVDKGGATIPAEAEVELWAEVQRGLDGPNAEGLLKEPVMVLVAAISPVPLLGL